MDFLDELQQRVLAGDGAMGTELRAAGVSPGHCYEELNVSQPDLVRGIHQQYVAAGARVIETNSFGANGVRLAAHGLEHRVNEINWTAAQLARDATKGTGAYVAGSVGPLGISAAEAASQGIDRHAIFLEQIGALLDGGCQVIFLETFRDVDELLIALNAKHTLHHCPVVGLLTAIDPAHIPAAIGKLRAADADIVGVNCLDGAQTLALLDTWPVPDQDAGPLAAYPSAGLPDDRGNRLVYPETPEGFAATGLALSARGVRLIGGCCGTGPGHIAALAKALEQTGRPALN